MPSAPSLQKVIRNILVGNQAREALQHDLISASFNTLGFKPCTHMDWGSGQSSCRGFDNFPDHSYTHSLGSKSKGEVAHCWKQRHRALLPQSLPPRVVLSTGPLVSKLWPASSRAWIVNKSFTAQSKNNSFKLGIRTFRHHARSTCVLRLRITVSNFWLTFNEWSGWYTSIKDFKQILHSFRRTQA